MYKIYGIKQCSTMQKAFAWFANESIPHEFHDYKKLGIDSATLTHWCAQVGWESLLNTRGTTWRKLTEAERSDLDQARAIALMQAHPSLIKRPVITGAANLLLGFDESRYSAEMKA
jgi:arsenate reductase